MKMFGKLGRRLPELLSLFLFMLLCACVAYWVMQLDKPTSRAVVALPQTENTQVDLTTASGLFGGGGTVTVASNYQIKGILVANNADDSVAIISAEGQPSRAVREGKEFLPGTSLKEVHPTYVMLSEGGVLKRVTLPENLPPSLSPSIGFPIVTSAPAPAIPIVSPAIRQDTPLAAPDAPAIPVK